MNYTKGTFECRRDNLTIRGLVFRTEGDGKMPAVIISHGFGGRMTDGEVYAQPFLKAGYVAFCENFCGSGSGLSDGETTDMSIVTEKHDLAAVLDYIDGLDYVEKGRTILAGCSQGGMVSALLGPEREDDVSALALYYPALCIPDDARRGSMLGGKFDPANIPDTFVSAGITLGHVYAEDAQKLDPYKEICTFKKPVLICHGTDDFCVPISYAERAAQLYPDVKYYAIKGGDHGFNVAGHDEAMAATEAFLKTL